MFEYGEGLSISPELKKALEERNIKFQRHVRYKINIPMQFHATNVLCGAYSANSNREFSSQLWIGNSAWTDERAFSLHHDEIYSCYLTGRHSSQSESINYQLRFKVVDNCIHLVSMEKCTKKATACFGRTSLL